MPLSNIKPHGCTGSSRIIKPINTLDRNIFHLRLLLGMSMIMCFMSIKSSMIYIHSHSARQTCLLDSNTQPTVFKIRIVTLMVWWQVLPVCIKKMAYLAAFPGQSKRHDLELICFHYNRSPIYHYASCSCSMNTGCQGFWWCYSQCWSAYQFSKPVNWKKALMNLTTMQRSLHTSIIRSFCPQHTLPMSSCARWGLRLQFPLLSNTLTST